MKNLCRCLCITVMLGLPLVSQAQAKLRSVTKVIYGDTLELDGGEVVRLIGAAAPKFKPDQLKPDGSPKHPNSANAGFVKRSKVFTEGVIQGQKVWIEYGQQKIYEGQTWVFLFFKLDSSKMVGGGGSRPLLTTGSYMLNRLLVQYGMATADNPFPFKYRSQFKQLQQEAQMGQVGLYQDNF